jgi:hypothetical protein
MPACAAFVANLVSVADGAAKAGAAANSDAAMHAEIIFIGFLLSIACGVRTRTKQSKNATARFAAPTTQQRRS